MSLMELAKFLADTRTGPGTPTPLTLAKAVTIHNNGTRPWDEIIPEFMDAFYVATSDSQRRRMIADEPPMPLYWQSTEPVPGSHIYLGGIAEWLATSAGIDVPSWTNNPDRFSAQPLFPNDHGQPYSDDEQQKLRDSALPEFARRNYFVNDRMHERSFRWIEAFDPASTRRRRIKIPNPWAKPAA